MPFGLKNVGATYQREIMSMFHDMIYDNVEVYVDDILSNFTTKDDHVSNFKNIVQRMREYKLKLEPQKFAFVISSSKFIGIII